MTAVRHIPGWRRRLGAGLVALSLVAVTPVATTAAGLDEMLDAAAEGLDEAVGALVDLGTEIAVDFAVEAGFELGCDALDDLPTAKDACISLVGYERITLDAEKLVDDFADSVELDGIAQRLADLAGAEDPAARATELAALDGVLAEDLEWMYGTLDQLDTILDDRRFLVANVRLLNSPAIRDSVPDAVTSALSKVPLEVLERDLIVWTAIREEVAGTLSSLEDLRLLIAEEGAEAAAAASAQDATVDPASGDQAGGEAAFPPEWLDGNTGAAVDFRYGSPSAYGEPSFTLSRPASSHTEECWTLEDGLHYCAARARGWVSVYQEFELGYLWYDLENRFTCELHVLSLGDGFTSGEYAKVDPMDDARSCSRHPAEGQLLNFTILGMEWDYQ